MQSLSAAEADCLDELNVIRNSQLPPNVKAAKLIAELSAKCGNIPEYYLELGSYYIAQNDYLKAKEQFLNVIDNYKEAAHQGGLGIGKIALHKKDFQEALDVFTGLVEKYPKWDKGYEHLGIAYVQTKNYRKAIDVLELGAKLNSNNYQVFRYLGFSYYYLSDPSKAINFFDKAFALNKQLLLDVPLMVAAARSYIDIGKYDVAKSLLTILISNVEGVENDQNYILAVKYYNEKSGAD